MLLLEVQAPVTYDILISLRILAPYKCPNSAPLTPWLWARQYSTSPALWAAPLESPAENSVVGLFCLWCCLGIYATPCDISSIPKSFSHEEPDVIEMCYLSKGPNTMAVPMLMISSKLMCKATLLDPYWWGVLITIMIKKISLIHMIYIKSESFWEDLESFIVKK